MPIQIANYRPAPPLAVARRGNDDRPHLHKGWQQGIDIVHLEPDSDGWAGWLIFSSRIQLEHHAVDLG